MRAICTPSGRRIAATIGPEAMLHRARARARGPAHRGDAAGRWRRAGSWSSRRRPDSARPRCSSTPCWRRPRPAAACAAAAPGPLERHFGFGVVRALLEGPLRDASDEQRARLLEGAAAPAGALLLDGRCPAPTATMAIAHSVLWLCSALADDAPLVLVWTTPTGPTARRSRCSPTWRGGSASCRCSSPSGPGPTIPTRPPTCSA